MNRPPAAEQSLGVGRRTGKHRFSVAIVSGAAAIGVMAASSTLGNVHGPTLQQKLVAFIGAAVFAILAVVAVQSTASSVAALLVARAGPSSGTVVKVMISFFGYVVVLFVGLGMLDVPLERLLIGGALTGVIVGIAAQQALGNVFAGIVLLLARPFVVGERIRVRSGALGGVFDGVVTAMSLTYVSIQTDEGLVNVPNSTLLAVGVGPAPPPSGPQAPPPGTAAPDKAGSPPGAPGDGWGLSRRVPGLLSRAAGGGHQRLRRPGAPPPPPPSPPPPAPPPPPP